MVTRTPSGNQVCGRSLRVHLLFRDAINVSIGQTDSHFHLLDLSNQMFLGVHHVL